MHSLYLSPPDNLIPPSVRIVLYASGKDKINSCMFTLLIIVLHFANIDDFLFWCLLISVFQVVHDWFVEQVWLLGTNWNVLLETLLIEVLYVLTIYLDRSVVGVVQAKLCLVFEYLQSGWKDSTYRSHSSPQRSKCRVLGTSDLCFSK